MTQKLWGGRFAKDTAASVAAFTTSLDVDGRLYAQDIAGSIAHARMLGRQRIIPLEDAQSIVSGLGTIYAELLQHGPSGDFEDIHSLIESRLTALVGPAAGRLHTARSRNDQVALDLRLYAREAAIRFIDGISALQESLVRRAGEHLHTLLPGYTHMQRAQPVRLAHHLLAYVEMLQRDIERMQDGLKRIEVMPLGSGALAGSPYPLDRPYVANLLGFPMISANSLDAVSDRDFVVEHLAAMALVAVHCSRLSEELVLWCTQEFAFVDMDDAHATGSSIMPQKKNPDVAELVRGRTGRVIGALVDLLTTLKGLPLAYNRDLQEDKQAYFRALDTALPGVQLLAEVIDGLTFHSERMGAAADDPLLTATDLADHLVTLGMAFREAHHVVGRVVTYCIDESRSLRDLQPSELGAFAPILAQHPPDLSSRASADAREVPGGTGGLAVSAALQSATERLSVTRGWIDDRRARLPDIASLLALPWG
ncbi:MAG: argininosuccinate lyase [Chloroflexota bacterium]